MYLPKPYFRNVSHYGDLYVDKVIIDYDGLIPVYFSLRNDANKLFICSCYDTSDGQHWIVAPITPALLIDVLSDKSTLATPFYRCGDAVIIDWNHDTETEMHTLVHREEIHPEILPAEGEYLEDDVDFWSDYIQTLTAEIAATNEVDIWGIPAKSQYSNRFICLSRQNAVSFTHHVLFQDFKNAEPQLTSAESFLYLMQDTNFNKIFA